MTVSTLNRVDNIQEAVKVANEIERLEAVLKSMKDDLKTFVDKNGPVETSEKVWDYNESVSWKFESDQLKSLAQDMILDGKNAWEYLSLSSTGLNKLGWGENTLSKYGKKKTTKRFSSRKK